MSGRPRPAEKGVAKAARPEDTRSQKSVRSNVRAALLVMIMLKRIGWLLVVIAGCGTADASAQQPKPDEGIPIQSELVRARCGGCHKVDDKMRMTRISYRRA